MSRDSNIFSPETPEGLPLKLFERVKMLSHIAGKSGISLAEKIGVNKHTFLGYLSEKRQDNLWPLLDRILAAHPEVSRNWLYFGEGLMLIADNADDENEQNLLDQLAEARKKIQQYETGRGTAASAPAGITPALPIVGLAACGVMGLEQIMPFAITASPVVLGPRSIAVVASGDSMIPAGIASGQICFCDPDQEPLEGEAVFLRLKDDTGALKLYLGRAEREGFTRFTGWLPKNGEGIQKGFDLEISDLKIDFIAPVVLVRRRL